MVRPHQGEIFLDHNFTTAFDNLSGHGKIELMTDVGTQFSCAASQTRDGRKVIRFFQHGVEYARCYECCMHAYVTDRQILDELARVHPHGKMLFEAPLCIAVCGDTTISASFWVQDCAATTQNLLLAATALGLGAVWLGVYPRQDRVNNIRKALKLPDTIIPLNLISIGHPAETKEPRTQYDEQRVHRQHW